MAEILSDGEKCLKYIRMTPSTWTKLAPAYSKANCTARSRYNSSAAQLTLEFLFRQQVHTLNFVCSDQLCVCSAPTFGRDGVSWQTTRRPRPFELDHLTNIPPPPTHTHTPPPHTYIDISAAVFFVSAQLK